MFVGNIDAVSAALVRRGYRGDATQMDRTHYLYGRPPDLVLRKSGQGGVYGNWVRIWLAPFSYHGHAVLLAQLGRPLGGRFVVTDDAVVQPHPNIDEVRNRFLGDMMYSGGLGKLGFITGVGRVEREQPLTSFDGTAYFTDGIRTVYFLVTHPTDMSEVDILDWYPAIQLWENAVSPSNKKPSH